MKETDKLKLKKPEQEDMVNIADINENMDTLDTAVSGIQELIDNGINADTVDDQHAEDFCKAAHYNVDYRANDANLPKGIYSIEDLDIGLNSNRTALFVNQDTQKLGYGSQLAIPYDNGEMTGVYYRNAKGTDFQPWKSVADGGNADKLDGKHANAFALADGALSNSVWTDARAAKLDLVDVNVSTRAPANTALSNGVWTDGRAAKLDNLNVDVNSRAPASTALSNGTWTNARAAKLDHMDVNVSTRADGSVWTAGRAAKLDLVDVNVSTRAPASTALSSGVWTNTRAAKLDNLNVDVNSRAPANTALSNGIWTNVRAAKLDNLNVDVNSRAPASTALSNSTWTNGRAANLDRIQAVLNTPNGDSLGAWINSISTNVNTTAARTLQNGQSAAYWAKVAFDHAAAANTNASAAISKAEAARVAAVNAGRAKGVTFLRGSAFKDGDIAINLTGAGILLAIIVATGNSATSQCSIELDGTRIGLVYLPTVLDGNVMLTGYRDDSNYCMGVSKTPGASLNIPYKSSLIIRAIRCTYTNHISVLYIPL